MALIRCIHHGRPKSKRYVQASYLSYAGLGTVICGRGLCFDVGFVWPTRTDALEYADHGRRMFLFPSSAAKVAAGEQLTLDGAYRQAEQWARPAPDGWALLHDGLTPPGPPMRRAPGASTRR